MKRQYERLGRNESCGAFSIDSLGLSQEKGRLFEAKDRGESQEQPTPEQFLVREAAKYLTPQQKKVWALHNFDRLTQDEIAQKLGMKQPNVAASIKAIEKRIVKWVKSNMGAYKLLKHETGEGA